MKKITFLLFSAFMLTLSWQASAQLTEGFESGLVSLSNEAGNGVDWTTSTSYFSEGAQSAHNAYASSNTNTLVSGALDISGLTTPRLTFDHIAKTEGGWDFCYVEISTNGTDWTILDTYDEDSYSEWGTSGTTPANDWWMNEEFDLTSYISATTYIRFRLASDSSGVRYGWLLDNVVVEETPTDTLDYYNLQWPGTGTITNGDGFNVYAQCWEDGLTNASATPAAGIEAWIGYSSADTDPSGTGWTWVAATANPGYDFNADNDEFLLNLDTEVGPGVYYYASRWRLNGASYSYGGFDAGLGGADGAWDGTEDISGVLTVNPAPGAVCTDPIIVSSLPYNVTDDTSNYGDNYGTTDRPALGGEQYVDGTGSDSYLTGDDVVYSFTPSEDGVYSFELSNTLDDWIGFWLFEGCDPFTSIVARHTSTSGTTRSFPALNLVSGTTYYVVISTWTSPQSTPYTLDITQITCPDPSGIAASSVTATTADLTWTAGGSEGLWNLAWNGGADFDPEVDTPEGTASGLTSAAYNATGLTPDTTYYIYYQADCTGGDTSAWVGPFEGTTLPSCPAPSDLEGANVTTTTAPLTWTENGTATAWNLEWKAGADFTPGIGEQDGMASPTVSPSYTLTGLTPATIYYVYYQADCGGETSTWVGPVFGPTACETVTAFPWTEDFESVTTPDLPVCWQPADNNGDGDIFKTYTTYGVSGSQAVGLYTDFNSGNNNDYLILPPFSLTGNERLKFSVRARSSGEPNDYRVILSTATNDTADFTEELIPLTTVSSTTHTETGVNLSAYTGDVYIAIHVPSGGLDGYYIYFDDFVVEEIPAVAPNCSVVSTPADASTGQDVTTSLSWDVNVDATGYRLTLGTTSGGTDILNNSDLGNVTTYTPVSNLAFETTYYATLIAYNVTGDATGCAETSFTTSANPNFGGGPDGTDANNPNSGGYFFANDTPDATTAPSQPSYSWIDPVAAGHTQITDWTDDGATGGDDSYLTIPDIGFDFVFYGNTYRTGNVHVNSNGAVMFGTGSFSTSATGSTNSIPSTAEAGDFIAGCWMDLNDDTAGTEGKIYYGGTSDRFVVTWWHYNDYADEAEYITFQIILYASGNIVIQYNDVESSADELGDAGSTATIYGDALIGIENSTEDKGVQYRNNGVGGPIFGSPLALGFTTTDTSLSIEGVTSFEGFKYFPNPVNDNLSLRAQQNIQNVSVLNMLGQEVLRVAPNSISSEVDMSALNAGAYFVKVTINDTTETIKIIRK